MNLDDLIPLLSMLFAVTAIAMSLGSVYYGRRSRRAAERAAAGRGRAAAALERIEARRRRIADE